MFKNRGFLEEPATISIIGAIAGGVSAASGLINATKSKGSSIIAPADPIQLPKALDPQGTQGGDEARRRAAAAGGIMSNIATSSSGTTGAASITGKKLLGE